MFKFVEKGINSVELIEVNDYIEWNWEENIRW